MGATLDETRLELEAQRQRVRGTAERLESATRRSLDVRALIGRHPAQTVGLAAGAAFFLLGGPHRTVWAIRRALGAGANGEKAYQGLPPALRAFVDASAPGFGAAKAEAKGEMALALLAWRADPKNRKKADRIITRALTPPGPSGAFWAFVEVAGVTAAGIIAKQVVARRLAGGAARSLFGSSPTDIAPAAKPSESAQSGPSATRADGPSETGYSGWSGRQASVAGPAREPAESTKPTR